MIFHSYVKLPEGKPKITCQMHVVKACESNKKPSHFWICLMLYTNYRLYYIQPNYIYLWFGNVLFSRFNHGNSGLWIRMLLPQWIAVAILPIGSPILETFPSHEVFTNGQGLNPRLVHFSQRNGVTTKVLLLVSLRILQGAQAVKSWGLGEPCLNPHTMHFYVNG